jgi:hypothetical protein
VDGAARSGSAVAGATIRPSQVHPSQKGLVLKPSQRLALAAFLAVLAALSLAACGGGSESDEDKITDVITEAAVEEKPEHCTELLTQKFNEQTQKVSGEEAVEECEEEAEDGDNAEAVEVTNVQVNGGGAKADVAFTGSDFDGQTLTVALVEDGDQWKLDEVVGFAKFDREKLLSGLGESLEEDSEGGKEAEVSECVLEGLEELDDESLESIFVSPSAEAIVELAEACQ